MQTLALLFIYIFFFWHAQINELFYSPQNYILGK